MNTATKQTVHELETLTFEQRWLMQELLNRPGATELHRSLGEWVFVVDGKTQDCVPQKDITELADADLIEPTITSNSAYVVWWPTISGRAALLQEPVAKPEPFAHALPGLAAELITPDTSHLERIATALEDIAAGVLAIDGLLKRFVSDADDKDPWQSDAMAGHHE